MGVDERTWSFKAESGDRLDLVGASRSRNELRFLLGDLGER